MSWIPAALGVAQAGLTMLPTEQSRYNAEQLRKLKEQKAKGQLGLTGTEREQLASSMLQPVRTAATQQQSMSDATLAATGRTSGADLSRVRTETGRTLGAAAEEAGRTVAQANLDRARQQEAEIEQRLAFKAQRQADLMEGASQVGSEIASAAGKLAAYGGKGAPSTAKLEQRLGSYGWEQADAKYLADLTAKNPEAVQRAIQVALSGGPMTDEERSLVALLAKYDPGLLTGNPRTSLSLWPQTQESQPVFGANDKHPGVITY